MVFPIYDKQEQMEIEQYVHHQVSKEFEGKDIVTNKPQDLVELQVYVQGITNKYIADNYYYDKAPKVLINLAEPHVIDVFLN